MKKIRILLAILIPFTAWYYWKHPLQTVLEVRNQKFVIELAVTPKEKERGLSFRNTLAPDHGMLFVYDHKEPFGFWMREMRFPLDFIWIDGDTIVEVTHNVQIRDANGGWTTLGPQKPVDKVLEVNAGTIDSYNIEVGDTISIHY